MINRRHHHLKASLRTTTVSLGSLRLWTMGTMHHRTNSVTTRHLRLDKLNISSTSSLSMYLGLKTLNR